MTAQHRYAVQQWIFGGLVALSAANSILGAFVVIRGGSISESTQMLWYFAFSLLIAVWTRNDIMQRGSSTTREYPPFVIFLFWPIVLPFHLLKSRGIRGLVVLAGFVGIYLAPYLVSVAVWTNAS